MTPDTALAKLAERVGVLPAFTDMQGVVHDTTPETQRALIAANGLAVGSATELRESLADLDHRQSSAYVPQDVVITAGRPQAVPLAMPAEWHVICEDGTTLLAQGRGAREIQLPALPDGVHRLHLTGGKGAQVANLITAPARVPSLHDLTGQVRTWGVVAALYGLRTAPAKTLADFGDLADLAGILGAQGAGFIGVNPVHALGIAAKDTISPYSPTHRGFLNTDHIALTGAAPCAPAALIDYGRHRQLHRAALATAFDAFQAAASDHDRADFQRFCAEGGAPLDDFARFEAMSEAQGADWRGWSADHRPAADRVTFHKWGQWRADGQLGGAQAAAQSGGLALGLYLDLAVGARVGGAESWGETSAAATGVTLGAPPDHLSPAGQNWQLAALSPYRLQRTGYAALRFVLRQNMRHCGLLRIDHALGLSRSFWIPEDGSPGGYIRQPFQALMAVIAIEACRAGTAIVGEDLGLVPPGFRDEMATRGLYGYSVLQYEKDDQGNFLPTTSLRKQSLACFGTHDTPTLAGFWQGRDMAWWHRLGWISRAEAVSARRTRSREKRQLTGIAPPDPLPKRATKKLRDRVHRRLADVPADLVAVQLDDILCLSDAQNLPGTIDEHPNWRRAYPLTLDQIARGADLKKTARIMTDAGRAAKTRKDKT